MPFVDAEVLHTTAKRLADDATRLDEHARQLTENVRDVTWTGPAADSFRDLNEQRVSQLRAQAEELRRLAAQAYVFEVRLRMEQLQLLAVEGRVRAAYAGAYGPMNFPRSGDTAWRDWERNLPAESNT